MLRFVGVVYFCLTFDRGGGRLRLKLKCQCRLKKLALISIRLDPASPIFFILALFPFSYYHLWCCSNLIN